MRVTYPAPAPVGHLDRPPHPHPPGQRDPRDAVRHDAHPMLRLVGVPRGRTRSLDRSLHRTRSADHRRRPPPPGLRHWDVSVNRWFVRQRTGALDAVTAVGSHLAETPTVVGVGLIVVALVWWRRRDLYAVGILVVGLTLEVTVFVTTTLFVDRPRPPVHHLDTAPADVELPERPHRGRDRACTSG